jgi:copper transport protein
VIRFFLVLALCAAGEALAHAGLVGSSPADGATLAAPPPRIELRFNEEVRPIALRLVDGDGKAVELAAPHVQGAVVSVDVPEQLGMGHYTLSFRVTSLDSHPVGGSIAFGVGDAVSAAGGVAAPEWSLSRIVVRAARDLALLVAAGGALFVLLLGPFPYHRRVLSAAALTGAVLACLGIWMQGTGLRSTFGLSAGVAIAGLAAIAFPQRWLMAIGAIAALASLPLTGHVLITHPAWLGVGALAAHAAAAAFWIGSLVALALILRRDPQRAAAALRRFSPLGAIAVALLVAGAVALGFLQLQGLSDLKEAAYGRLMSGKAVMLCLLITLALVNRYRLLPALERGDAHAGRSLIRSIWMEGVVIGVVIALTAVLVQTPPPERPHEQTLTEGAQKAVLSVAPARAGANVISVRLAGVEELTLELANPGARVEPIVRPMQRVGAERWRYEGSELAFPGTWELTLRARIGDFEKVSFNTRLTIR